MAELRLRPDIPFPIIPEDFLPVQTNISKTENSHKIFDLSRIWRKSDADEDWTRNNFQLYPHGEE
jgi:hypothetical protein